MKLVELSVSDVSDEQLVRYRFQARNYGGLTGRLFINDVEIHQFSPDQSLVSCDNIQNWLMPGENKLVISITAAPEHCPVGGQSLYECSLHGMTHPSIPDDTNCLWEVKIDSLIEPPPVSQYYSFEFTSLQVPTSSLWKKAEVMEILDPHDRENILVLQNALLNAFEVGDVKQVMDIYRYVVEEEASMRNADVRDSTQMVEEEISFLADLKKQGLIEFIKEDDVYFNQLVGNRVVQLCSERGGSPLTIRSSDGENIQLNLYASRINGDWNLVRR